MPKYVEGGGIRGNTAGLDILTDGAEFVPMLLCSEGRYLQWRCLP